MIVAPVYRAAPRPPDAKAEPSADVSRGALAEPLIHRQAPEPQLAADDRPTPTAPSLPAPPPPAPPPLPDQVPPPPLPAPSAGSNLGEADQWSRSPGEPGAGVAAGFAPYDLTDTLRRMHGIDVSDVLVNRGDDAGLAATAMGARAFTADAEVFLPPDAGPIERPQTRALLAHELTHAAQQRALGPAMPPEDSVAGAALESAAVAVERRLLGHDRAGQERAAAAQPLFHAPAFHASAFEATQRTEPASSALAASAPVQRQTEDIDHGLPAGNAFDPLGLLPQQAATPVPDPLLDGLPQRSDARLDAREPDIELDLVRGRLLQLAEQRLLDLDDSVAMAELADGIYKRLRARLQRELLVDRERAGLLSDFR